MELRVVKSLGVIFGWTMEQSFVPREYTRIVLLSLILIQTIVLHYSRDR